MSNEQAVDGRPGGPPTRNGVPPAGADNHLQALGVLIGLGWLALVGGFVMAAASFAIAADAGRQLHVQASLGSGLIAALPGVGIGLLGAILVAAGYTGLSSHRSHHALRETLARLDAGGPPPQADRE